MISFKEATGTIMDGVSSLPSNEVSFSESLGKVLAEDIYSHDAIPLFDNSAMDGYAVASGETTGASREKPVTLRVVETIFAGHTPDYALTEGRAARIMTGGVIPQGADAVVVVENTRSSGDEVELLQAVRAGENVRYKGEDCRPGELIIGRDTVVGPAEIGMLATLGITRVKVVPPPRVAIIATGDELVEPWEPLAPGKLRNSNSYSLAALVSCSGGIPELLGVSRDDRNSLREKILKALAAADLLITVAGVSVGEGDLVREVFQELGGQLSFWGVAIRPGKPTAYGKIRGIPYFGLPGNPVSCMVTYLQFVHRAIQKMRGATHYAPHEITARLGSEVEKKKGLRYFYRVKISQTEGGTLATTTGPQGSGILTSMVRSDGMIALPEERDKMSAGEEVTVEVYPWRIP